MRLFDRLKGEQIISAATRMGPKKDKNLSANTNDGNVDKTNEASSEQTAIANGPNVELAEPAAVPSTSKIQREGPANWETVYANIQEMRKDRTAAVDSMGCERCHDDKAAEKDQRFQSLVSLMLSSQTKDEVTHAAMERLKAHGCTVNNLMTTSEEALGKLIYPVGFWRRKATYIKRTCEILQRNYDCDIPATVPDLCKLPGVGPKMAYLCMNSAWKINVGIGVDTHVHRISDRLGWTTNAKTPEATRKSLEEWLPVDKWQEINWLLVGFGQQRCLPVNPRCGDCLNLNLCPFGQKQVAKTTKKK